MFFAKKSYWIINPFTIFNMREVSRYTGMGHRFDTEAIDKLLNNRKGFSYFKLIG